MYINEILETAYGSKCRRMIKYILMSLFSGVMVRVEISILPPYDTHQIMLFLSLKTVNVSSFLQNGVHSPLPLI